jgi:hypothetical protein
MRSKKDTLKYIIKTDNDRTYSLYIMEASEYLKGKYIGLFLYYDNGQEIGTAEELWSKLRHRLLFENSIEAVKAKVMEYGDGRNEKYIFLEVQEPYLV